MRETSNENSTGSIKKQESFQVRLLFSLSLFYKCIQRELLVNSSARTTEHASYCGRICREHNVIDARWTIFRVQSSK
jgi:hypothetical protein